MKGKELKDFYLVGHSFGGYVCGNYALKHHSKIKKLILLSPLGLKLTDFAIDESGETISKNDNNMNPSAYNEFPVVV
jgi:pimeloyl-ACP methyl ester carboxylesterase